MDTWHSVAAHRSKLAEWARGLDQAQANAASWCSGWRVRDVLGHLVHLAEASQGRILRDVLRYGPAPDRALDQRARDLGEHHVSELADRLARAADGRYHVIGSPRLVVLGELLVHGCDMRRALGEPDDVDPEEATPLLTLYRRVGRLAFHAKPATMVTLTATDAPFSMGSGPVVSGRAVDLLLLLANRRQVVASLTGPGVDLLA